mmetsp:Transcript_99905/g.149675  ORF Transcript_99905/g.149675 Transcript_99905/m.149675 type:complete len:119 (-) Transcript_99905:293-649(-)
MLLEAQQTWVTLSPRKGRRVTAAIHCTTRLVDATTTTSSTSATAANFRIATTSSPSTHSIPGGTSFEFDEFDGLFAALAFAMMLILLRSGIVLNDADFQILYGSTKFVLDTMIAEKRR